MAKRLINAENYPTKPPVGESHLKFTHIVYDIQALS